MAHCRFASYGGLLCCTPNWPGGTDQTLPGHSPAVATHTTRLTNLSPRHEQIPP